jgi:hypothetical protein
MYPFHSHVMGIHTLITCTHSHGCEWAARTDAGRGVAGRDSIAIERARRHPQATFFVPEAEEEHVK